MPRPTAVVRATSPPLAESATSSIGDRGRSPTATRAARESPHTENALRPSAIGVDVGSTRLDVDAAASVDLTKAKTPTEYGVHLLHDRFRLLLARDVPDVPDRQLATRTTHDKTLGFPADYFPRLVIRIRVTAQGRTVRERQCQCAAVGRTIDHCLSDQRREGQRMPRLIDAG